MPKLPSAVTQQTPAAESASPSSSKQTVLSLFQTKRENREKETRKASTSEKQESLPPQPRPRRILKVIDSSDEEEEVEEVSILCKEGKREKEENAKEEDIENVKDTKIKSQEKEEQAQPKTKETKVSAREEKLRECKHRLASILAKGFTSAITKGQAVDQVIQEDTQDEKEESKNKKSNVTVGKAALEKLIQSIATREKRQGDSKYRWWLHAESHNLLQDKSELDQLLHQEKAVLLSEDSTLPREESNKSPSTKDETPASAKKKKVVTAEDDDRITTYTAWQASVEAEMEEALESNVSVDNLAAKLSQKGKKLQWEMPLENNMQDIESEEVSKTIAWYIQGQRGTLEELAQSLHSKALPKLDVASISTKVVLLAERKAYGARDKNAIASTDTSREAMWRWEVVNSALLPKEVWKLVLESRRRLQYLGKRLLAAHRLVKTLSANVQGKLEVKACKEIEAVQKLQREDELARQKNEEKARKEAEKEAQKKKLQQQKDEQTKLSNADNSTNGGDSGASNKATEPSSAKKKKPSKAPGAKPLTHFFQKARKEIHNSELTNCKSGNDANNVSTDNQSSNKGDKEADEDDDVCMVAKSTSVTMDHLTSGEPLDLMEWVHSLQERRRRRCSIQKASKTRAEELESNQGVELLEDQNDAVAANKCKKKLFQFHGTLRPPYFGTFRKRSCKVKPRKPLAKEESIDYEVDSDLEWEEIPDDAESIADSEANTEDGEEELDYQDGWLMEDDVVEYESGVEKDSDEDEDEQSTLKDEENRKRKRRRVIGAQGTHMEQYKIGILYDKERIESGQEGEVAKNLLRYTVASLPGDHSLPSLEDIQHELLPRKRKRDTASKKDKTGSQPCSPNTQQQQQQGGQLFPEDQLQVLAKTVQGSVLGVKQLVDEFYQAQRNRFALEFSKKQHDIESDQPSKQLVLRSPTPKKHIRAKVLEIAKREKRDGDSKPRWYVDESLLNLQQVNSS